LATRVVGRTIDAGGAQMRSLDGIRNHLPALGILVAVIAGLAVGMLPWLLWGESATPETAGNRALLIGVAGLLIPILPAAVLGAAGETHGTGALVALVVATGASIALGFEAGARPYAAGADYDMDWVPAAIGLLLVPVGLGSLFGYTLGRSARPGRTN